MRVKLKVMRGASEGKEIEVKGPVFLIGRSEECNLRANSDAISRKHCEIRLVDNEVRVRDLGSRNGTQVNGDRIEGPRRVVMGDQLRIGPLEFLVVVSDLVKESPVKKPADKTSDGDDIGGMISDWLSESDDQPRNSADRETREYRFDEPEPALDETTANSSATSKTQELPKIKPDSTPGKKKDEKGKLPIQKPKNAPKDTQEAAAQTLRKFFNRG